MHNDLTKQDIEKMQAELDDRILRQRPVLIEEVKRTRAFGDHSENYEYKAAKQAKNRNESRIRYLTNMIKTATVIEDHSAQDEVGLFDKVTLYLPEDDETMVVRVCTTVRTDPSSGPSWAAMPGTRCPSVSMTATATTPSSAASKNRRTTAPRRCSPIKKSDRMR